MVSVETFNSLSEAAGALGQGTAYLGGGTLVMRGVNYGDQSFHRIVRTTDTSLGQIRNEGNRLVIGAGVRMVDVINSPELAFLAPAARAVGGPAIRNMATVGGNLFAPHPYGDLATALLALDGIAHMADGQEIGLEDFFTRRETLGGLVAAVSIERQAAGDFRFTKVSRVKPKGVSVLSIAAFLPRQSGGLGNVRVAYGAMGPTPVRAKAVEAALQGANLDENGIARALGVAADGLQPPDDALASGWYRREVLPVHLRRLLLGERGR